MRLHGGAVSRRARARLGRLPVARWLAARVPPLVACRLSGCRLSRVGAVHVAVRREEVVAVGTVQSGSQYVHHFCEKLPDRIESRRLVYMGGLGRAKPSPR
eukprot:2824145-Prymnesium_polylepis.1